MTLDSKCNLSSTRLVCRLLKLAAPSSNVTGEKTSTHYYDKLQENSTLINATIIFFYTMTIIVSLFGNLIVCKIVFTGSRKKSTTNLYIGNLSISDLMMTFINIPLQLTQVLSRNWPLGYFFCKSLPFFGGLSVAASTLTMAFIALDRYQVIAHPLKPRPSYKITIYKILFIWLIAFVLSFPYSFMEHITKYPIMYGRDSIIRCTIEYPSPEYMYRLIFTIIALLLHFFGPLTVSVVTYVKICLIIWKRKCIGAVQVDQQLHQRVAKWKTIKMLMIVLVAFIVCWLPLNLYHIYEDARVVKNAMKHNSIVWFVCHWCAMCSACCNPFIYCWLNEKFRKVAKSYLQWSFTLKRLKSPTPDLHFLGRNYKMRISISRSTNFCRQFSTFSSQSKDFQHQTSRSEEESRPSFNRAIVAKTTDDSMFIAKQFPKNDDSVKKNSFSHEKGYSLIDSVV